MIRGVMVAALSLFLSACESATPDPTEPDAASDNTHGVPVGAVCRVESAHLCADGYGICLESRCELQCRDPYPLCPSGMHAVWQTIEATARRICHCAND